MTDASCEHLRPEVRRLMSEGKGEDAIARALGITRHQARKLTREIELADAKQVALVAPATPGVSFAAMLRIDPEAWAIRINARWRQSRENIIEAGRLLLDAKAACPHGSFENEVMTRLHFSPNVAQRLMAIARDPRLSNPAHVQLLPPSWGTLYELTKLSDEEFDRGVQEQIIRPDMERKEVEILRPTPSRALPGPSSDESGSPVAYNPGPHGESLQQGLDTSSIPGTAHRGAQGEGTGAANVAKPERQSDVPDGSPVSPGPSETPSMPGGGLAIAHNRVEPSDSLDYFPTPPWATRALFEHVLVGMPNPADHSYDLWEPACGEGHMAEVLREYCGNAEVLATDIFDYGYGDRVLDFHSDEAKLVELRDWIITNPPFVNSTEFVLKALELAGTGVAMFVRLTWLESVGRYERIFRDQPPTILAIFSERVPLHKGRWVEDGGTMTAYIWLVWIKGEHHTIDIRVWWFSGSTLKPGKTGITLAVRHVHELAGALTMARDVADNLGIRGPS